jgi:hypothetical protein
LLKLEIGESDKHDENWSDPNSVEGANNTLDLTQFRPVEVKEEPWNNPASSFSLLQSKQRVVTLAIVERSDENLQIEKWVPPFHLLHSLFCILANFLFIRCDEICLDNIRFLDSKERVETKVVLTVLSILPDKVIAAWPSSTEPLLIEKAGSKRLVGTLDVNWKMNQFSTPFRIREDIGFRLLPRDKSKKKSISTPVLEQFRGMLQTNYKSKTESTFRVKLTKEKRVDEKLEVSAIIEQHQTELQQVSKFLQAEKLRQELELQAKLEERKIQAPPLSPTVSKSLRKLEQSLVSYLLLVTLLSSNKNVFKSLTRVPTFPSADS